LERYDPVTHRWETLADMPDRKSALGGGVIDGRFCVFGGRIAQGLPTGNALPDTWCYDPASDTWMKGQDMITPRAVLGSVELGGEIYAIGGRLGESSRPTVEKLVP
jgi:N-acetylneuraminic acid mutarotase